LTGVFLKGKRVMIADEIQRLSKKKETSVVGAGHYNDDLQWQNEGKKRKVSIGNFTWRDRRQSYVTDTANNLILMPSPDKYDKVKLDTYKQRTLNYKIHTSNFPRFKPIEKSKDASPTSYNANDSLEKAVWKNIQYSFYGKMERVGMFEQKARKNKNPSAAHYNIGKAYDHISKHSPRGGKKRH
jgi:hypothetical protein